MELICLISGSHPVEEEHTTWGHMGKSKTIRKAEHRETSRRQMTLQKEVALGAYVRERHRLV